MAFWSGNGSLITIGVTTLNCRMTRWRQGARLTENTHSGTAATNFDQVVKDNSWSLSVPFDETNIPDTDFGLVEGAKVTIVLNAGGSGKSVTLTNTSVESVEYVCDNAGDIIRAEVSGRGGSLTRMTT